jgi:hypothetical protein
MLGEGGAQFTSKVAGSGKGFRIDVENPNPGVRPGQVHVHTPGKGKYLYNFNTGQAEGMPKTAMKKLAKDPAFLKGIRDSARILGLLK